MSTLNKLSTLTNGQFVEFCYNALLGRSPDNMGFGDWLLALSTGLTRSDLITEFLISSEFTVQSRTPADQWRRFTSLLFPENYARHIPDLLPITVPEIAGVLPIVKRAISDALAENLSFASLLERLGYPGAANAWVANVGGSEIIGATPKRLIENNWLIRLVFDDRAEREVPLRSVILKPVPEEDDELILFKLRVSSYFEFHHPFGKVSVVTQAGELFPPSPLYIAGPEAAVLMSALDAALSSSYAIFNSPPFR